MVLLESSAVSIDDMLELVEANSTSVRSESSRSSCCSSSVDSMLSRERERESEPASKGGIK